MISCLHEGSTELKTLNQRFTKHLQHKSEKLTKISLWSKTNITSRKKQKVLTNKK